MKPLKPRYIDAVKVDWKISKKCKDIVALYSKYSKYDENEIIDNLILDILQDQDFVKWLENRRYQVKIKKLISLEDAMLGIDTSEGAVVIEENEKDSRNK